MKHKRDVDGCGNESRKRQPLPIYFFARLSTSADSDAYRQACGIAQGHILVWRPFASAIHMIVCRSGRVILNGSCQLLQALPARTARYRLLD